MMLDSSLSDTLVDISNQALDCVQQFNFKKAHELYEQVLSDYPHDLYTLRALAFLLIEELCIDEALPLLKQVAQLSNNPYSWAEYISYSTHVKEDLQAETYFQETFCKSLYKEPPQCENNRIGFIGSMFCQSAVGRVLLPLFRKLSKDKEIVVFCDNRTDDYSQKIKEFTKEWYLTSRNSDNQLAELIRVKKINTLVDTQGYKMRSRVLALAENPSPHIYTYCGYHGKVGNIENIENMDTEWKWEYEDVSDKPEQLVPIVKYGSVHRPAKINQQTQQIWSKLLTVTSPALILVRGGEKNTKARETLERNGLLFNAFELTDRLPSHFSYLNFLNLFWCHLPTVPYGAGATKFDIENMGRTQL